MKKYPPEVIEFIKQHVQGTTTKDLVFLVNTEFGTDFTESKMKSLKTNCKLKSGTPCGLPKGHASSLFQQPAIDYIRANYKGVGNKEMAERLNTKFGTEYTTKQLNSFYKNHGLHCGLTGRFEKGHTPPNKGKKGFCSPGSEKGWFSKGHTPLNKMPIGSEVMKGDGYIWVKTGEGSRDWRQKHILIWEQQNGKIPGGYILTFLDGDRTNITLDNLALITLAESLAMTRLNLRSSNPEYTKTGIIIAKVKRAGYERKKEKKKL